MIRTRDGNLNLEECFDMGFIRATETASAIAVNAITIMRNRLPVCFVPGDVATANALLDEVESAIFLHLIEVSQ